MERLRSRRRRCARDAADRPAGPGRDPRLGGRARCDPQRPRGARCRGCANARERLDGARQPQRRRPRARAGPVRACAGRRLPRRLDRHGRKLARLREARVAVGAGGRRAGERAARESLARRVLPCPQSPADAGGDVRPVGAEARAQRRIGAVERGLQRGDARLNARRGGAAHARRGGRWTFTA